MQQLDAGAWRGALVGVRELRMYFPCVSKRAFDAAMLQASREGVITLHRHDYVASLTQPELSDLVHSPADDSWSTERFPGAYFCGVAIRQS
jgi:hypothetical protein